MQNILLLLLLPSNKMLIFLINVLLISFNVQSVKLHSRVNETIQTSLSTSHERFSGEDEQFFSENSDELVCAQCSHKRPQIEHFSYNFDDNDAIHLSWNSLEETLDKCKFTYWINQTWHKFPYFKYRSVFENSFVVFENALSCTKYNLTIQISNYCNNNATFSTILFTEPEIIDNLHIEPNLGIISWSNTASEECANYRLLIDKQSYNSDSNEFFYNNTLFCKEIGIQSVRSDNKYGKIYSEIVGPGTVENLRTENNDENLVWVYWNKPKEYECVNNYIIRYNNLTFEFNRHENSMLITTLHFCQFYEIGVAAVSIDNEGEFANSSINIQEPSILMPIQNINVIDVKNGIALSWEVAANQEKCIQYFYINITNDHSELAINQIVNETEYFLDNAVGCGNYNISIAAVSQKHESEPVTILYSYKYKAPKYPSLEVISINSTSVRVKVRGESLRENACKLKSANIICESSNNRTFTKRISDYSETPIVDINLQYLSAHTHYKCTAMVENDEYKSIVSAPVEFTTKEDVPSKVNAFNVVVKNENDLMLTWAKPTSIPGNLKLYELSINSEPLHYVPHECEDLSTNSIVNISPKDYFFELTNYKANYKYLCSIRAKIVDFGESVDLVIITDTSKPETPRNIKYNLIEVHGIGEAYKNKLRLNWTFPCNTNGNFSHFSIIVSPLEFLSRQIHANNPLNNTHYTIVIDNIEPYTNYEIFISTVTYDNESAPEIIKFSSFEGPPSNPIIQSVTSKTSNAFLIEWIKPFYPNGKILDYEIIILIKQPLHYVPPTCDTYTGKSIAKVNNSLSFMFDKAHPHYKYEISVVARTKAGIGDTEGPFLFQTNKSEPEPIRNLTYILNYDLINEYNANVTITFEEPCNINGNFVSFFLLLQGERNGNIIEEGQENSSLVYIFTLLPAYNYNLSVIVNNDVGQSEEVSINFTAPSGVPELNEEYKLNLLLIETTNITISLDRDLFTNDFGDILYYSIMIGGKLAYNDNTQHSGDKSNVMNPSFLKTNENGNIHLYQATPYKWNPFRNRNIKEVRFTIGADDCLETIDYCNGPLQPNMEYVIFIRAFTENAYKDSEPINVRTLDDSNLIIIITGVSTAIVAIIVLVVVIVYLKKYRKSDSLLQNLEKNDMDAIPRPIPIQKFPVHYAQLSANSLKNEFALLGKQNISLSTSTASLIENKKRNRYVNILPYDETRVILQNNNTSDYINASYIKGYTNQIEYIATQGPLEHTVKDFWQMVIDENVKIIIMVAQFVEHNKNKCHQYFPNANEILDFDEFKITCKCELLHDFYCKRVITIELDGKEVNIIHLQFLNWPDFGCPKGTDNMLTFAMLMRKYIQEEICTRTVIHCSAGVGRTGTLIALDMLLQKIDNNCDIDIFDTVLNLRKQRKSMVQAEAQYFYIYDCVADAILNPPKMNNYDLISEPIYENCKELTNNIELKAELKMDDNLNES